MADAVRALSFYRSTPVGRFRPWKSPKNGANPQLEFLQAARLTNKRVFRAGNRTGKTLILAYDVLAQMLGFHPYRRSKPGMKAWVSGVDRPTGIGDDLWPAFRFFLARHQDDCFEVGCDCPLDRRLITRERYWSSGAKEIPDVIQLRRWGNRVPEITFKSADSKRRKYQGSRGIDLFAINEEHPEEIYWEGRRGLMTTGGQLLVGLTPIDRMAWVQDLEGEDDTVTVRASTLDAAHAGVAHLPTVLDTLKALPERQRRLRELGDYVELEGAVYASFHKTTHVAKPENGWLVLGGQRVCPWPIPAHFPRYGACDFGMGAGHATAILKAAHDNTQGRLIVYNCWYAEGIPAFRWAEWLRADLADLCAPLVCDHDQQGRSAMQLMGVATLAAPKSSRRAGLDLVERLLEPVANDGLPKIVLVDDPTRTHPNLPPSSRRCDAHKVWWEAERYRYPKDKDGRALRKDEPIKKNDHAMDALRYLCMYLVLACEGVLQDTLF